MTRRSFIAELVLLIWLLLVPSGWSQVAFDASSVSAITAGADIDLSHNPVGTPRGVIVWVVQDNNASDQVTSVTYGGDAMTEVAGSPLALGSGELSVVHCFFLGTSIPTDDPASVFMTNSGGASKIMFCVTVTASDDTEINDVDATINSTSTTNPSVTLSLGGVSSFAAIGFHSGQNAVTGITPLTNWNPRAEDDFGTKTAGFYTYDIISGSDVTAGWTQAADDGNAIAVSINEVGAVAPTRRIFFVN